MDFSICQKKTKEIFCESFLKILLDIPKVEFILLLLQIVNFFRCKVVDFVYIDFCMLVLLLENRFDNYII